MKKFKFFVVIILCLVFVLGAIGYFVFQTEPFGGTFEGARLERMKASPEYHDDHFENVPPQNTDSNLINNLKPYMQGQVRHPTFPIPVEHIPVEKLKAPPSPGLRAYWFGHASVMVEIDGVRIMTDPVLSRFASPVDLGPERFHESPVPLKEMTGIDAVVISHDHYDHLDMKTVKRLASQGTHFYVGLGVGAHLERWKIPLVQIHEMDWWETLDIKGVKIHCTPARHYSGRKKMDNSTLWTSWLVKGPAHSFYYSGDTGYAGHFSEIKEKLGAPELTLMKVGAYGKPWLDIHMDPESAIQAHLDLGGKIFLPVHWATFNLAYHAWEEPIIRTLSAATKNAAKKQVHVITPRIGEEFDFEKPFQNLNWFAK